MTRRSGTPGMITRVRSAAGYIDARPTVWIALAAGTAVSWVATFLVARAVHLSGSWVPSAVSATAGWFAVVVLAVTVWEIVQVIRDGPEILLAQPERHNWPRAWIPPLLLAVGIVVGWLLFK